jgi:anti-sigma28 factor (negative regulator of flagellin synthesis)
MARKKIKTKKTAEIKAGIQDSKLLVANKKLLSNMLVKIAKMEEELKDMENNPDNEKAQELKKAIQEKLEELNKTEEN